MSEMGEDRHAAFEVISIAVPMEGPQPPGEITVEPGTDVERALRIEHPLQPLDTHSGSGQRRMAVDDQARIAEARPILNRCLIEYPTGTPSTMEPPGARQPDDASPDDDDRFLFLQRHG